jgi:DNA repair exonuclease SbcCD ATPase subunit
VQATEPAAEPSPPKGAAPAKNDSDLIQQQRNRLQIEQELVAQLKQQVDAARAEAKELKLELIDAHKQLRDAQNRLTQAQGEKDNLRQETAEARGALQRAVGGSVATDKDKDQLKKLLAEREEAAAQAAQAAAQAAQAQARLRQLDEVITERWPDRKARPSLPPATSQPAKSAELILRSYQIEELIADGRGGESSRASADVISVITQMVAPESWTTQGGPGTIACFGKTRTLFVNQTKEVHAEVTKMLDELRARAVHQQREAEESMRREMERVKQLPRTPKKE